MRDRSGRDKKYYGYSAIVSALFLSPIVVAMAFGVGTEYRSAIFYQNDKQKMQTETHIKSSTRRGFTGSQPSQN